jgi:hypothetical protein
MKFRQLKTLLIQIKNPEIYNFVQNPQQKIPKLRSLFKIPRAETSKQIIEKFIILFYQKTYKQKITKLRSLFKIHRARVPDP